MEILYLTIAFPQKGHRNLYSDLVEELQDSGHSVTVVAVEGANNIDSTDLRDENGVEVLRVKVGDQFGVGLIKKGITTLKIEPYLKKAINKFIIDRDYDLILYSTPPVTIANVVEYCKTKFNAKSYLMLKDIFPQNAVDLQMISKRGVIYKYFKNKEKKLYKYSDKIGCMSQGNIDYMCHNDSVLNSKLELFPNTTKIQNPLTINKRQVRIKNDLPLNKTIFILGGNLGRPQSLDFLLDAIENLEMYQQAYFLIIGEGSDKHKIVNFIEQNNPTNLKFISKLPKKEYDEILKACDVGLINLNHNFSIPNYPSRVLTYMHEALPILAATDEVTDIREMIQEKAECGLWCASDKVENFISHIKTFSEEPILRKRYGENGRKYLEKNLNIQKSVKKLENFIMEGQDV